MADTPMVTITTIAASKPWWKSRTVWLGVLQIVGAYGGYVGTLFPPAAAAAGAAAGIATIILRTLTTQPVTVTSK